MKQIGDKVSYLRNPLARRGFGCLGFGLAALALGGVSVYMSVSRAGQGGLNTGAYGFASIMACLAALWYGFLAFREKERNYILARIGTWMSLVLLILWTVIIITGIIG